MSRRIISGFESCKDYASSNHIGFCGVSLHLTCIVDIILSDDTVVNKARMHVYGTYNAFGMEP